VWFTGCTTAALHKAGVSKILSFSGCISLDFRRNTVEVFKEVVQFRET